MNRRFNRAKRRHLLSILSNGITRTLSNLRVSFGGMELKGVKEVRYNPGPPVLVAFGNPLDPEAEVKIRDVARWHDGPVRPSRWHRKVAESRQEASYLAQCIREGIMSREQAERLLPVGVTLKMVEGLS